VNFDAPKKPLLYVDGGGRFNWLPGCMPGVFVLYGWHRPPVAADGPNAWVGGP
jgi:hypothetical protein